MSKRRIKARVSAKKQRKPQFPLSRFPLSWMIWVIPGVAIVVAGVVLYKRAPIALTFADLRTYVRESLSHPVSEQGARAISSTIGAPNTEK